MEREGVGLLLRHEVKNSQCLLASSRFPDSGCAGDARALRPS